MSIEGQLDIELFPRANINARVSIRSTRPLAASRILIGKTPEQVLQTLPMVYRVCGIAQSRASAIALQNAMKVSAYPATRRAWEMLTHVETAREHLWRILIDWPAFIQGKPDKAPIASLTNLVRGFQRALFGGHEAFRLDAVPSIDAMELHEQIAYLEEVLLSTLFIQDFEEWRDQLATKNGCQWISQGNGIAAGLLRHVLEYDWQSAGATQSMVMPELSSARLNTRLSADDAEGFINQPNWNDQPYETGTLARLSSHALLSSCMQEYGNGLLTRLLARLIELAEIPERLRQIASELEHSKAKPVSIHEDQDIADNTGLSQIEAARGRLVHRVELEDGLVSRYQVVAPTEWNFHPRGVVAQSLSVLSAQDQASLQVQARLLINAIDPCVGYSLRIH